MSLLVAWEESGAPLLSGCLSMLLGTLSSSIAVEQRNKRPKTLYHSYESAASTLSSSAAMSLMHLSSLVF